MKESYLDYHYENMLPETEWLFITPSLDSGDLQMQVQEMGNFIFEGKHYTRRGPLESYQISYQESTTSGTIRFRGNEYPFPGEGTVIFIDCRRGYDIETEGKNRSIFVHFWSPAVAYYYELFMELNGNSPVLNEPSPVVYQNMHKLFDIYRNPNTRRDDAYAELLIMEMVMDLLKRVAREKRRAYSEYVLKTLKVIQENYMQNISLDWLAERVHVSKYYLSHIFKKEVGLTPANYIQQYRVNRAKELLVTTDLSQEIICDRVGLYNSSHMSKLFRIHEGLTPDQYRKKWGASFGSKNED